MAIEEILHALTTEAEQQADEILQGAREQVACIEAATQSDVDSIISRRLSQAEARAKAQAARVVNEVRSEHREKAARFREESVDAAFDDALSSMSSLRDDPAYEQLFIRLADEAMRGVEGDVEWRVDPADEELARRVAVRYGPGLTVVASLSSAGGLVVGHGNGSIQLHNTVEARVEKARRVLRTEVAEMLFR